MIEDIVDILCTTLQPQKQNKGNDISSMAICYCPLQVEGKSAGPQHYSRDPHPIWEATYKQAPFILKNFPMC